MSFWDKHKHTTVAGVGGAVAMGAGAVGLTRQPSIDGATESLKGAYHGADQSDIAGVSPGRAQQLSQAAEFSGREQADNFAALMASGMLSPAVIETLVKANREELTRLREAASKELTSQQLKETDERLREVNQRQSVLNEVATTIEHFNTQAKQFETAMRDEQLRGFNQTVAAVGKMMFAAVGLDDKMSQREQEKALSSPAKRDAMEIQEAFAERMGVHPLILFPDYGDISADRELPGISIGESLTSRGRERQEVLEEHKAIGRKWENLIRTMSGGGDGEED